MHSLRHSHATNLLPRGVPLPAVSARLGHADVNITARIYAHALPDHDRRAADTWDSVVTGDGGVAGDGAVTGPVQ
jgi:integrase